MSLLNFLDKVDKIDSFNSNISIPKPPEEKPFGDPNEFLKKKIGEEKKEKKDIVISKGYRYDSVEDTTKQYRSNRGFYYDSQLEDPFLSISLHPNKYLKDGADGANDNDWLSTEDKSLCLEPISKSDWSAKYLKRPIARCIMSEDFSFSINNNWSDYNGGNPIEDIFNNAKPFAPLLGKLGEGIEKGVKDTKKNGNFGSWIVNSISGLVNDWGLGKLLKNGESYLNKALLVQGTRYSYYSGTSFNFNNLEMKYVVFSDYIKGLDGTWEFQSVDDYVKSIKPYVMGIYAPVNSKGLTEYEDFNKFLSDYCGFQSPPGGFKMSTKNLDNVLEGTLRLNIGGTWAIENLIIKNMNVTMSRVQAKHPIGDGSTVPLYAEIVLQLAPVSMLIDTGYSRIIEHSGVTNLRKNISSGYKDEMDTIKNKLTNVQKT